MRVLLAEDEVTIFVTLRDALEDAGHVVVGAQDTAGALAALEGDEPPEVVVTDVRMPGAGGLVVLQRALALDPDRPVLLMTGYATVDDAVAAMRMGAVDYVQKPFRNDTIVQRVAALARVRTLEDENRALRTQLEARGEGFAGVVGASEAMRAVFARVRTVAPTEATVTIEGESGTGKERIALALHHLSRRSSGPFVALSCAALPENLLEAELFGHERGAFTDAKKSRRGRVELADGGSLFLDDIDDMPLAVQVKLLRVLQERTFERVGSEDTLRSDFRVIVATKAPLRQLVRDGRFREDLFYRVHVVPIVLPPLRERRGDVPLLVHEFLRRHGGGRTYHIAPALLRAMERYPWPGNVRELENALQRAIALAGDGAELASEDLLPADPRWRGAAQVPDQVRPLREVLREAEARHLARALELTGGHRSQCAELLGISRKVLWEKLRDHGLRRPAKPRTSRSTEPGTVGARRESLRAGRGGHVARPAHRAGFRGRPRAAERRGRAFWPALRGAASRAARPRGVGRQRRAPAARGRCTHGALRRVVRRGARGCAWRTSHVTRRGHGSWLAREAGAHRLPRRPLRCMGRALSAGAHGHGAGRGRARAARRRGRGRGPPAGQPRHAAGRGVRAARGCHAAPRRARADRRRGPCLCALPAR